MQTLAMFEQHIAPENVLNAAEQHQLTGGNTSWVTTKITSTRYLTGTIGSNKTSGGTRYTVYQYHVGTGQTRSYSFNVSDIKFW